MTAACERLPDPRRYAADAPHHPFSALARPQLQQELRNALIGERDAEISAALNAAPSQPAYADLWHAVCDVAHHAVGEPGAAVVARIFALPLVIVTGSRLPGSLPGMVPDIAEIKMLLEQHGALGRSRNFGIGNALCAYQTLAQVKPSEIYAWTAAAGSVQRDLAPCSIDIPQPGEHVHLRFLVGACITPESEPSFIEAASNIGRWGMPLTRALAAQFSQPGIDVLPLPRPPLELMRAAHAGRAAQLEAALDLFVSNSVRRFRSVSGDPAAVVSVHDDGDLRVSLSSPFDDTMTAGFRWPLYPLDDLQAIKDLVAELLAGCRLTDVRCAQDIMPALNAHGQTSFLTARDVESAAASGVAH